MKPAGVAIKKEGNDDIAINKFMHICIYHVCAATMLSNILACCKVSDVWCDRIKGKWELVYKYKPLYPFMYPI